MSQVQKTGSPKNETNKLLGEILHVLKVDARIEEPRQVKWKGAYKLMFSVLLGFFCYMTFVFSDVSWYIIVSLFIVVALFVFLLFFSHKPAFEEFEQTVNFLITLFTTLIGVYIGLTLNSQQQKNNTNRDVLGWLQAVKDEYTAVHKDVQDNVQTFSNKYSPLDSSFGTVQENQILSMRPELLDIFIQESSMFLAVNSKLAYHFIDRNSDIQTAFDDLQAPFIRTISAYHTAADLALFQCRAAEKFINLQISLLRKEKSEDQIDKELQNINIELDREYKDLKKQHPDITDLEPIFPQGRRQGDGYFIIGSNGEVIKGGTDQKVEIRPE